MHVILSLNSLNSHFSYNVCWTGQVILVQNFAILHITAFCFYILSDCKPEIDNKLYLNICLTPLAFKINFYLTVLCSYSTIPNRFPQLKNKNSKVVHIAPWLLNLNYSGACPQCLHLTVKSDWLQSFLQSLKHFWLQTLWHNF